MRYFGAFAPNAKLRRKIITDPKLGSGLDVPDPSDDGGAAQAQLAFNLEEALPYDPLELGPPPLPERKRYLDWARLLRRTSAEELLVCAKCGGKMKLTAFS
jgi:hypothetical protein